MKTYHLILPFALACNSAVAQNLASGLKLDAEVSATGSSGDYAPLWLSSNRYGASSTDSWNGIQRMKISRSADSDSLRNWKYEYALDFFLAEKGLSVFNLQQAYIKTAYKKFGVTVGAKEMPLVMKNAELSSGGLCYGINARPIPQVSLDVDYFSIPFTNSWWKWKAHLSYGFTTDGKWQKSFAADGTNYTSNTLYHEKALYWKFGKENHPIVPLTYEIGIQMANQFGGTGYNVAGRTLQGKTDLKFGHAFSDYIDALLCTGSDITDGTEPNTAGNHTGSYNMALAWHAKTWTVRAYFERYFEDQSMLTVQYGIQDHLLGVEAELPHNPFVTGVVVEHINTKSQSGAVYHDRTESIPDKMNGRDNYYNHSLYSGWQHWGQAIGNPLLTSPIYNTDGMIEFKNNRIKGWHIGLCGDPTADIHWRLLVSITHNWGTYIRPCSDVISQQYLLAEIGWRPARFCGWSGKLAFGYDYGKVLGNSFGTQLSIHKTFTLVK